MLYTEDTFEVEEYPYFGHMRGKYTAAEIKELDAYALSLGIELIPCIQTLAHLNAMFKWEGEFWDVFDCDDILLCDEEKTYDIVVVGAGTAGVPAVLTAIEEGATVGPITCEGVEYTYKELREAMGL